MRPHTLRQAVERIQDGTTSETALGEFLDYYNTASNEERVRSLAEEPAMVQALHFNALVAGIAEHLTNSYSTGTPPAWGESPARFLSYPWFAVKNADPALQEYLTWASPAAFKRRNIMTSGAPLRRAALARQIGRRRPPEPALSPLSATLPRD